jgi:predicted permease
MLSDFLFRLRAIFRRDSLERELDEELRFHFEREVAKHLATGWSLDEATRHARLQFGGHEQVKEECREARGVGFLETLFQDLRYGARTLRKNLGFASTAVLTLAIGVGSTAAAFSVVNAVLLKPLPYPDAGHIVMSWWLWPISQGFGDALPWTKRDFARFHRESKTFQHLGAFKPDSFNFTGSGEPVRLDGIRASAGFLPALGVAPILGRTFRAEEEQPGHEYEVVLSYGLWLDRFGGDTSLIGGSITLNGYAYTVIGVMPPDFSFPRGEEMPAVLDLPRQPQLWVPLDIPAAPRGPNEFAVIGRLLDGVTIAQALAELQVFGKRIETEIPTAVGWYTPLLTPLARQVAGDTRRPLLLMLGVVSVILLIACSNVANLLLARSLARTRELTLRGALGAGRGRLLRQLLTESLLLALLGGLLGTLLAQAAIHFLKIVGPSNLPRLREVTLDLRVLAFALGATLFSGLFFGLAPALAATRRNLMASLKEGGQRAVGGPAHPGLRNALLVSQLALALVLVIAAGLLVRTFYGMLRADAGFNSERILTFQLTLPGSKYSEPESMARVYHDALQRLQSAPGVQTVGLASVVPMGGAPDSTSIRLAAHPMVHAQEHPYANYMFISPGYFSAIAAPLLRGRDFSESDTADSQRVTIINAAMARRFWPGEDPIGKQVGVADVRWPTRTIVGIVADIKHGSLSEDPAPEMCVPYTQNEIKIWPSMQTMQIAIRTRLDPGSAIASAREALHAVDPDLPLAQPATLANLVDNSLVQPRFSMLLMVSFGVLALALASIGMYGLVSYSVVQRTREIGIRMTLGAVQSDLLRMVLGQGARLAAVGLVIGLAASFGVTRLMASFLYGVRPTDPFTFIAVSLLLLAVVLLACYLPARRAMRIDPIVALRHE